MYSMSTCNTVSAWTTSACLILSTKCVSSVKSVILQIRYEGRVHGRVLSLQWTTFYGLCQSHSARSIDVNAETARTKSHMCHAAISAVNAALIVDIARACVGMHMPRKHQVHLELVEELLQARPQMTCQAGIIISMQSTLPLLKQVQRTQSGCSGLTSFRPGVKPYRRSNMVHKQMVTSPASLTGCRLWHDADWQQVNAALQ